MGPGTLAQVLRPLQDLFTADRHPELLVGLAVSDDAAVYKLTEQIAVIQTLDFFPPVVDDPYDYGAVAAANAMSDVYAMGGQVVLALNICGFPPDLPPDVISEILRGGAEKVAEGGGVLAGGHTVKDEEPKYGLSVMGVVHPDQVWTKAAARPGDVLVLTKPLGVGIITTVLKADRAAAAHVVAAVSSMKKLNRQAAQIMQQVGVRAVTDITGFGLLGHSYEMAEKSGARLRFHLGKIPFLEGAREYADLCMFPGGTCNNERAYEHAVTFATGIEEEMQQLMYTPETSGGLLAAVPQEKVGRLAAQFDDAGHPYWVIGEVVAGEGVEVAP